MSDNIRETRTAAFAACPETDCDWSSFWRGWQAAIAAAPSAPVAQEPVAQEPVAWQDPDNLDRICSARTMLEAKRTGGATLSALKPLTRALYAAPPAAEQPECGCCGKTGPCDPDCDCAEQPTGTTSDQYRAELYDEVWGKARSMGYGNVTDALAELERLKAAEQPDTVAVPRELLDSAAGSCANGWVDYHTARELRALLAGGEE